MSLVSGDMMSEFDGEWRMITADDIRRNVDYLVQEIRVSIKSIADTLFAQRIIPHEVWGLVTDTGRTDQDKTRKVLQKVLEWEEDAGEAPGRACEKPPTPTAEQKVMIFLETLHKTANGHVVGELVRRNSEREDSDDDNNNNVHTRVKEEIFSAGSVSNPSFDTEPKIVAPAATVSQHVRQPEENTLPYTCSCTSPCSHDAGEETKPLVVYQQGDGDAAPGDNETPPKRIAISPVEHEEQHTALSVVTRCAPSMSLSVPVPVGRVTPPADPRTVDIQRVCQWLESLQDSCQWDRFKTELDNLHFEYINTVEFQAARLMLCIRQQCYQKRVSRRTLKALDTMINQVNSSDNALFLKCELLGSKGWACWLTGDRVGAGNAFIEAETLLEMMGAGKESGWVHYHTGFYYRYVYTKLDPLEKRDMGQLYLNKSLTHLNEAVRHFSMANDALGATARGRGRQPCASLLIYGRLLLAQHLLRTGVTIILDTLEAPSTSRIKTAEDHLDAIETDLWSHMSPFPKQCFLTCKADLYYLKGQYANSLNYIEQARNAAERFDIGNPMMRSALRRRMDIVRPLAHNEHSNSICVDDLISRPDNV